MFDYSLVDDAVELIVTEFHPQKVVIFGSAASGTAEDGSDIDILVVMDAEGDRISRRIPLIIALSRLRVDTDVLVVTPEEFERAKGDPASFVHEIMESGYVAYGVRWLQTAIYLPDHVRS